MNLLRSKKFQKHIAGVESWTTEISSVSPLFNYSTSVSISSSIWDDIHIETWLRTFLSLDGEVSFGIELIKHPLLEVAILQQRQESLQFFQYRKGLILNKDTENTLEWLRGVSHLDKNYLYNVLFPSSWYMKWMYLQPDICTLYQLYRCYFSPLSSSIYPFTLLLGPYWFVKNKLQWNLSLFQYFNLLKQAFMFIKQTTYASSTDWYKFVAIIFVYVSIYIYSTAQIIDLSLQLHKFRTLILSKIKILINIQKKLKCMYTFYGNYEFWKPYEPEINTSDLFFQIKPNLYTFHKLVTQPMMKQKIERLYKVCIIHDTLIKLSKKLSEEWCIPVYGSETFIGNMKNPMLSEKQVANPICLQKHLVISGPNAGGKTTYVKSLLWNILLGQSFGIVYGAYCQLKLYDAIIHHHRVKDITGDQSLFQAEMFKIKETLEILQTHTSAIYFLDEPMHSTHPVDGAAMLSALMYYLSPHKNIQVILTSHYFSIQTIAQEVPLRFQNLCVKAILMNKQVLFDFKIYRGGSQQTVGIELLEKEGFPEEIFITATKIKNKIYSQRVNV